MIEKLGMHFVRVMEDDGPEPPADQMPMLKVVTPSGKVGFVPADALSPLGNDQLCYVKDATGWKIARLHRRRAAVAPHRTANPRRVPE